MISVGTWWIILHQFFLPLIVMYAAMFSLIYIVGNIIAKTVQIVFFYGMRLYRYINSPNRDITELQWEYDPNRFLQILSEEDLGGPEDEEDE